MTSAGTQSYKGSGAEPTARPGAPDAGVRGLSPLKLIAFSWMDVHSSRQISLLLGVWQKTPKISEYLCLDRHRSQSNENNIRDRCHNLLAQSPARRVSFQQSIIASTKLFNYSCMMSKTAVQKDRFPSQFKRVATSFGGWNLEPPRRSLVTSLPRFGLKL